jgi:hypothetical protein
MWAYNGLKLILLISLSSPIGKTIDIWKIIIFDMVTEGGGISTVDLLVLTYLDLLFSIMQTLLTLS